MKLAQLLGWGIAIYAVMFLLWSAFVTYGFIVGFAPRILGLLILVLVALIAGNSLRFQSWSDILPYSIAWGIMMVLFDALMSVPVTGWRVYADVNVWFGYALIVLVPLFAPYVSRYLPK